MTGIVYLDYLPVGSINQDPIIIDLSESGDGLWSWLAKKDVNQELFCVENGSPIKSIQQIDQWYMGVVWKGSAASLGSSWGGGKLWCIVKFSKTSTIICEPHDIVQINLAKAIPLISAMKNENQQLATPPGKKLALSGTADNKETLQKLKSFFPYIYIICDIHVLARSAIESYEMICENRVWGYDIQRGMQTGAYPTQWVPPSPREPAWITVWFFHLSCFMPIERQRACNTK